MHNQIDELLKTNEYDIYNNPNVNKVNNLGLIEPPVRQK